MTVGCPYLPAYSQKLTSIVSRLIYLTIFYDVYGYQYWGREEISHDDAADAQEDSDSESDFYSNSDSDSDADEAARKDQLLRHAVRNFPGRALEEVALRIGVREENFERFRGRAREFAQRSPAAATKRELEQAGGDGAEDDVGAKRVRKTLINMTDTPAEWSSTSDPSEQVGYGPCSFEVRAREDEECKG